MLELAGGEALGVDVGDLLELERALEGDRVADVAAEEQHRAGVGHPVGELLDALLLLGEDPRGSCRGSTRARARAAPPRSCRRVPRTRPTCSAEQVQRGDLRDERLRRGDRDLGAGVRVDDRVGLARDGRTLRVADRQGLRAVLAGVLDGHERVHGLARLADRDDERVGADHRVAVAELVRELDVDRHARPLLDRVLADQRRRTRRCRRR